MGSGYAVKKRSPQKRVNKEKQTICFLENLRSIEEYIKGTQTTSPSYITLSRRLKEEGVIYIKNLLIKEIKE